MEGGKNKWKREYVHSGGKPVWDSETARMWI